MAEELNDKPTNDESAPQPADTSKADASAPAPASPTAPAAAETAPSAPDTPPGSGGNGSSGGGSTPPPPAGGGSGGGGAAPRKKGFAPETYVIGGLVAAMAVLTFLTFMRISDADDSLRYLRFGIGAICTVVIFSFLYKENPVYRFFEHVLVGLGVGYTVGITFFTVLVPKFFFNFSGKDGQPANYWWLLAIIPGSLWYFQLSKKRVWLSRLIIAFFLGVGAGQSFKGMYNALFGPQGEGQVLDTFRSFLNFGGDTTTIAIGANTLQSINNFIFLVVTVTVLSYFFFSYKHEGNPVLRHSAKTGRYLLMVAFGAIFGGAVMGRMALLIGRLDDLFNQWFKASLNILAGA